VSTGVDEPRDQGSISLFMVIVFMTAALMAGLVADAGRVLNANAHASDAAAKAARYGAQEVDPAGLRNGESRLIAPRAHAAASAYLTERHLDGQVQAAADSVTVTVTWPVRFTLLAALRPDVTVTQTRTAVPLSGPVEGP
jgi:Flp pilus assembly protein TadG